MNWLRIKALFLRHLYPLKRDFDILSDMIYWPLIDVLVWGITGKWMAESSGFPGAIVAFMMGLVLWNVIWRSQSEIGRNLMDEIWNYNLTNLFSTPLMLKEWITSVILLSVIKTTFTLVALVPVIFFLYSVNIFQFGWWLLVFFGCSAMTGWWMGFISSSIVIRYGQRMQVVIWTFPGMLLPFSAVYFPLDKLPPAAQFVSQFLPTTYIFESMRSLLISGTVDMNDIIKSIVLNIIYLVVAVIFFVKSFNKSRDLGFNRFG